jgi:nicotinamidase-related amidase
VPVSELDPATTALVLVDLQQGITTLPVQPHSAEEVVANGARLAEAFRAVGGPVVTVRVATSPDGGDALATEVDEARPARQPSPGWSDIVPAIRDDRDIVVTKKQWGAFYGTDLDLQLRRRHISTVVLGGIATNMGVESTARAGHEHGYHLVLVEDAMSGLSAEDHAFALTRIFPRIGRVASTSDVLAALRRPQG